MASDFSHTIESAVRGFHVYREVWIPYVNQVLQTRQEVGNSKDPYAVAVVKSSDTGEIIIGHVPREISRLCWYFIEDDGEISCTIIDANKKRSTALSQGGLEVKCCYKFVGKRKHIKKLRKLLDTKK